MPTGAVVANAKGDKLAVLAPDAQAADAAGDAPEATFEAPAAKETPEKPAAPPAAQVVPLPIPQRGTGAPPASEPGGDDTDKVEAATSTNRPHKPHAGTAKVEGAPDFGTAQKPDASAAPPQRVPPAVAAPVAAAPSAKPDVPGESKPSTGEPGTTSVVATSGAEPRAAATAAASVDASRHAPPPPPPAHQVAVQITRAVHEGVDRLTVELKPEALGRIHVQIEVSHDHRLVASVAADRPETLDLLQKDARVLERALQDSGLKTDSNSLSFSLREHGGRTAGYTPQQTADAYGAGPDDAMPPVPASTAIETWRISPTGINIQI